MAKIDRLFDELLARKGTDLHLSAGRPPLLRVGGELVTAQGGVLEREALDALLGEILTPGQRKKITEELDLDFAYAYEDKARFRANYFYAMAPIGGATPAGAAAPGRVAYGAAMGAVFRVVPTKVVGLSQLGCPESVRKLAERRSGLVLVAGPSGAGKSTTMAAMIDHINRTRACHIATVEDPVEFVHDPERALVTHREVGVHAPTFPIALRGVLRDDPEVVFVSDLRGKETIRAALELASSGVLVLATVTARTCAHAVERLVQAFDPVEQGQIRGSLADNLVGAVAQALAVGKEGSSRVAVHEVLLATPTTAQLVREGRTALFPNAMQAGASAGMQSMDMALEKLMAHHKITPELALELACDKEAFLRSVARVRPDLAEGIS
jgi:twitching motility protein PilT